MLRGHKDVPFVFTPKTECISVAYGACYLDVALTSASRGYTKVSPSRVSGATSVYHEAVILLMRFLDAEHTQAERDAQVDGPSELV